MTDVTTLTYSYDETTLEYTTEVTQIEAAGLGPPGPATSYVFDQDVESQTWVINHNLGRYPSVSIVVAGVEVEAEVEYIDANTIHIGFSVATAGSAYLN